MTSFGVLLLLCVVNQAFSLSNPILLEATCAGDVNLFPGTSFATSFNLGSGEAALQWYSDRLFKKVQCECPGFSRSNFDRLFNVADPAFWVAFVTGNMDRTISCSAGSTEWSNWLTSVGNNLLQNFSFPSTVNLNNLRAGSPGFFKWQLLNVDIAVGVAFGRCATSKLPWLSVSCVGTACATFGLPCVADTECAGFDFLVIFYAAKFLIFFSREVECLALILGLHKEML